MVEEFWIYENWRAHGHRATLHRASCSFCNRGEGLRPGSSAANGKWLGPFLDGALAVAEARETRAEVRVCGTCSPPVSL